MRTSRKAVTFNLPFRLGGLDAIQPPGTYIVVTEEEEIPGLSFISWRRVETTLRLPAVGCDTGLEQVIAINPRDLAEAVARDVKGST